MCFWQARFSHKMRLHGSPYITLYPYAEWETRAEWNANADISRYLIATGLSFSQKLMRLSASIPILRIFSEEKAKEFYLDFMGFSLEWEHRFGDDYPLYAQIRRSDLILHLSEHFGDATPGSAIFVPVQEIGVFQAELQVKSYRYAKPGIEAMPWGQVMEITDPFGNHLRFCEQSK